MIEAVIVLLIQLCLLALVVYLALWVLEKIGLHLPAQVIQILWVIVGLVAVLLILRVILPFLGIKMVGLLPMLA